MLLLNFDIGRCLTLVEMTIFALVRPLRGLNILLIRHFYQR